MTLALRRILVPMDFSAEAVHAAQYAVVLAQHLDAQVIFLHVWQEPMYMGPHAAVQIQPVGPLSLHAYAEQHSQKQMHACVRDVAKACGIADPDGFILGVDIHTRVEVGEPVESILRVAREEHVNLIVMGMHQRKREWQRLFHTCVAEHVRWSAHCPVLLLVVPPLAQGQPVMARPQPLGQIATDASMMACGATHERMG